MHAHLERCAVGCQLPQIGGGMKDREDYIRRQVFDGVVDAGNELSTWAMHKDKLIVSL
jgi:hypothetical protein